MSTLTAFLAALLPAATATLTKEPPAPVEPPVMPQFKGIVPGQRLDIRPVLWSLYNKPQDWQLGSNRRYIRHMPSAHDFDVGSFASHRLVAAHDCSCRQVREGKFSLKQKIQFHSAYKHWRNGHYADTIAKINNQFASHFN